jgi:hypothetical protein
MDEMLTISENDFLTILNRIRTCMGRILHTTMEIRVCKTILCRVKAEYFPPGSAQRHQQFCKIRKYERRMELRFIRLVGTRAQLALLLARLD